MSGYAIDPGELRSASGKLADLGESAGNHSKSISVAPDAGQSTGEIASAFADLANEAKQLSELLVRISDTVRASVLTYEATDEGVATEMRDRESR